MAYKFIEGLTVADVAFEASGPSLEKMFESASLATEKVQVKDLKKIKPKIKKHINLEADSAENLLFNFLQELIFFKDTEALLFSRFKIKIKTEKKKFLLSAEAAGEKLDMARHEIIVDVKAVTMHHFEVKKTGKIWKAVVVLDI